MKNKILCGLILSLLFFSLCTGTDDGSKTGIPDSSAPENEPTASSTMPAAEDGCASFPCAGSVQTREENDGTNICFCDGVESVRIKCGPGEVSIITLDEQTGTYSLCCEKPDDLPA